MCGILGIIGERTGEEKFLRILDGISHRGPDSYGTWFDENCGVSLGHRRLAIIDLSPAGFQPMHSHGERYVIVFNGEIYNYQELKRDLHFTAWKGHSDTEVLLQCIAEWGIEKTLSRVTGMFAFALWDKEKKEVTFARDRFGEKPLFLGKIGDGFFFSSELRPFYPHIDKSLNQEAIGHFFQLGFIPHPHTAFKSVFKLPPGSYLTLKFDEPFQDVGRAKKFWNFSPEKAPLLKISREEALREFDQRLQDVIRGQLISDVPVGAFLSGGIDSSVVTAIAQKVKGDPLKTFSLGIKDQKVNEAEFAKKIADHLRTDHTEFLVTPQEVLDLTPKLIGGFDEPFSDPSMVPTWIVSKLARSKVTVGLSGDGGDELFGGYNSYMRADKIRSMKKFVPGFLSPEMVPEIRYKNLSYLMKKALTATSAETYGDLFSFLADHSHEKLTRNKALPSYRRELYRDDRKGAMWWDATHYMTDEILVKVDRMSMKHSLEVRVPLMDHTLVEWVWSLPDELRFTGDSAKILLKDLLYKYVPRELVDRPKMGFGLPLGGWLRSELKPWAQERILRENEILDPVIVQRLWDEHQRGTKDNKFILWDIVCFNEWLATL